ncbi:MAG: hypothetical protein AAF581_11730 [Planctomycetota bacterium]
MQRCCLLSLLTCVVLTCFALIPAQADAQSSENTAWDVLKKHDKNGDGQIEPSEYTRGEERFRRLDTNSDGFITQSDLQDRGSRSSRRGAMAGRMLVSLADDNGDNAVTGDEWQQFLVALEPADDGTFAVAKLLDFVPERRQRMVRRMIGRLDRDNDGQSTVAELQTLHESVDRDGDGDLSAAEVGSGRRRGFRGGAPSGRNRGGGAPAPPQAGDSAPDFTLPYATDIEKTVTLSSYAGKRPVALIFGSYT